MSHWRIRALKIHPGAPKGASNEASDQWGRVLCEGIPYLCEVRKLCEWFLIYVKGFVGSLFMWRVLLVLYLCEAFCWFLIYVKGFSPFTCVYWRCTIYPYLLEIPILTGSTFATTGHRNQIKTCFGLTRSTAPWVSADVRINAYTLHGVVRP